MRRRIGISIAVLIVATAARQLGAADATPTATAADAARMSEGLIYSVNRTPERTFDTARHVEVITKEEIHRANVQNLGQLLERQLGIGVINGESGTMPIIRGMGGKQVMFLIDGVKVNNATWRGAAKEYLNIFDVSQIERIEIVRGVVSVLGMESLGGVVNIITKRAAAQDGDKIGWSLGVRYATAERSLRTSVAASTATGNFRLHAGAAYAHAGDTSGGGSIGLQRQTGVAQHGGHLNGQWLLSAEKTLSFGYHDFKASDQETPPKGYVQAGVFDPAHLQLFSVSYLDLTSRGWEDSIKVTVYRNRQNDVRDVLLLKSGVLSTGHEFDENILYGANLEFGTFIDRHHLLYGIDYTTESIVSTRLRTNLATGIGKPDRGNFTDGASYKSSSIYVQDQAPITKWLTAVGGVRAARFAAEGTENWVGQYRFSSQRSNVTGALSLIGHVTPHLNVVGSVVKGYRAPNLDDLSFSGPKPGFFTIPSPGLAPEKVLSIETGLKYESQRLQTELFYFRNAFTNYIVPTRTTYKGRDFNDQNGDGIKQNEDGYIIQNQNVGKANIKGFEGSVAYALSSALSMYASYSHLIGTDEINDAPLTLMPPASGSFGVRYSSFATRQPWAEVGMRFAQKQTRLSATDIANPYIGPNGSEAYQVVDVRGGMTLMQRVRLTVALENVTDEDYHFIASNRYQPGRQFVLGTQLNF